MMVEFPSAVCCFSVVLDVTTPVQKLVRSFILWEEVEEKSCGTMTYISLTQVRNNRSVFFS